MVIIIRIINMNDFLKCNKVAGVHWIKGHIDRIKIKIKLKPPEDVISLPMFEDYTNGTAYPSLEQNVEEFSFKWQEKAFSPYELQHYADIHNCVTENELKYHELLINKEISPNKVSSYVHDDYFMPLPEEKQIRNNALCSYLEKLSLGGQINGKSESERHLFKSQESFNEEEQWTAMHVVFDHSDFNEGTILLRREAILVSLYHNIKLNYVIISPDINNIETNAYNVENNVGELLGYQYEVDIDFGEEDDGEELVTLLTKLYKKWEKKHKCLVNFVMPPGGRTQYYVTVDLTSAKGFDVGNLYIEYNIKLPEGVQCNDMLHGRTHVSESTCIDGENVCHYGHLLELCLETDSGLDTPPLNLYFEVISIDMWHRHRTEGYTYCSLPLTAGYNTTQLKCVRPEETKGEERRFYVGGCNLISDLEVLSSAELQGGNSAYTATGSLQLRTTVMAQSAATPRPAAGPARDAAAVLRGAEAALRKYRKARARLALATSRTD